MATGEVYTGIPVCDVMYSCRYHLRKHIKLEILLPNMVEKRILKKREHKWLLRQDNPHEDFLAILNNFSLEKFMVFLEILIDVGQSEPAGTEGGTRDFMRIMAGSVEKMNPQRGSKLDETITRFISTAFSQSTQSQTLERLSIQEKLEEQARLKLPQPKTIAAENEPSFTVYDSPMIATDKTVSETSDRLSLDGGVPVRSQAQISATASTAEERPTPNMPTWEVIYNSRDSFKKFMKMENLVPVMVKKKILKRKQGDRILKQDDPAEIVIAILQGSTLEKFTVYLDILIELGGSEPADTEGGTRALMRLMKGSLEAMKPEPGSKLDQTITRFKTAAFPSSKQTEQTQLQTHSSETELLCLDTQTQAETQLTSSDVLSIAEVVSVDSSSTDHSTIETPTKLEEKLQHKFDSTAPIEMETENPTTVNPTSSAPKRPPAGQIGEAVGGFFTSDGGMLYSPIHGVSVSIPPNAIPAKSMCYLGMHFYLGGPFVLADGVVSCSVVVWFYQSHYFEFLEDVTVKIPHAAKIDVTNGGDDNSLCVLTWGEDKEGPIYKLSKEVSADFSDGYHAVFKVRHFSPYITGLRERTIKDALQCLHSVKNPTIRKRTRSNASNTRSLKQLVKMKVGSLDLERYVHDLTISAAPSWCSSRGRTDSGISSISSSTSCSTRLGSIDVDSPSLVRCESEERKETISKIGYSIARLMPSDRSGNKWETTFAACYNHSTGNWVLQKFAEEIYGRGGFDFKCNSFQTCRDYLKFIPSEWKGDSNSWRVFATETNVITTEDIECVNVPPDLASIQAGSIEATPDSELKKLIELIALKQYPPSVAYSVECDANPPDDRLNCRIEVEGAMAADGKPPFFVLTSSVGKHTRKHFTQQERILYTGSYLYGEESDIICALYSANPDICLDFQKPDHIKFLADISFQITDAPRLSQALGLRDYQLHSIESNNARIGNTSLVVYQLLAKWACSKGRDARLSVLKDALSTIGYRDILLCDYHDTTAINEGEADLLISPHFDSIPLPNFSPSLSSSSEIERNFLRVLSEKLQCCWRSIGHLMGIPNLDLDTVAMEHPPPEPLYEQSYHMIYKWQRKNGRGATYGILFKAIKCLFDRSLDSINDAYCYVVKKLVVIMIMRGSQ